MSRYIVVCHDCDHRETFDDSDPPSYAAGLGWDAKSAAMGSRDGHAADTGIVEPYETHDVELQADSDS